MKDEEFLKSCEYWISVLSGRNSMVEWLDANAKMISQSLWEYKDGTYSYDEMLTFYNEFLTEKYGEIPPEI
jgi:hypothetical protein